jgi:hypothetical protein
VDHAGGDAGYRSDMTRFPDQHFSAAVLCNSADTSPTSLVLKVADIYLAEDMKEPEQSAGAATAAPSAGITYTEQQLAGLAGLYWDRDDDQFRNSYLKDGKLHVSLGREEDFILKPVGETLFHLAEVPFGDQVNLHFEPAAGNRPRRLLESFDDGKPNVFEAVTPFTPSAAERAEYAGSYVSDEIDPVYRMIVQDGKLVLTRLKHKPDSLEPRIRDVFSGEIGTIRFTRDSNHRVSGFLLSTGRIRNFRFTRRAN